MGYEHAQRGLAHCPKSQPLAVPFNGLLNSVHCEGSRVLLEELYLTLGPFTIQSFEREFGLSCLPSPSVVSWMGHYLYLLRKGVVTAHLFYRSEFHGNRRG